MHVVRAIKIKVESGALQVCMRLESIINVYRAPVMSRDVSKLPCETAYSLYFILALAYNNIDVRKYVYKVFSPRAPLPAPSAGLTAQLYGFSARDATMCFSSRKTLLAAARAMKKVL